MLKLCLFPYADLIYTMIDYRDQSPQILRDFLAYHETIKAHSQKTVDEYFLDLRNFFRYMLQARDPSLRNTPWDEISIMGVDLDFVQSITLTDVYGYLSYLSRDRAQQQNSDRTGYGVGAATRARKIATLRSFFNYLTSKVHLLEVNPIKDLDSPKLKKTLPKYLTLDESIELLDSVDGANRERDYCMLTLFLNCGLRISELIGLNLSDIQDDALRILGKGDKTRIVYLNEACRSALENYLAVRRPIIGRDQDALFLSSRNRSRAGQKAPEPGRTGQYPVLRPQASPHRGHTDAAKWRGRPGSPGGPGPRASEHHRDLHPHRKRRPAGGRQGQSPGKGKSEEKIIGKRRYRLFPVVSTSLLVLRLGVQRQGVLRLIFRQRILPLPHFDILFLKWYTTDDPQLGSL